MTKQEAIDQNRLIYLASPYTSKEKSAWRRSFDQNLRYQFALRAASTLSQEGVIVFSPIVHSHPMHVTHGLEGDWAFWSRIDLKFIDVADAVWVLDVDGWRTSTGVTSELNYARERNKALGLLSFPSLTLSALL